MPKKIPSGFFIFFCLALILSGVDKKEKAYELIYKDVQLLKKQFLELNGKIDQNTNTILTIKKKIEEILTLSQSLQSEQSRLKDEQKQFPTQLRVIIEKLEGMTIQLSQLSEDMIELRNSSLRPSALIEGTEDAGGTESSPLPETGQHSDDTAGEESTSAESGAVARPNLSPREVYNMAYSDYLKGNYSLAVDGFQIYLDQFPESPYADNALYWIGECYFSQRDFETAIEYFNRLILVYPQGDKVPAGYLKKGICLIETEKEEEALSVLRLLISKYPLENEAKIAQQKINEIIDQ